LGFLIYSNTFQASFHFDDDKILDTPHVRIKTLSEIVKTGKSSLFRRVAYISFALNYYFHQYNVTGYHVVNIIIHILTGIFLYVFIRITLGLSTFQSFHSSLPGHINPTFIAFGAALVWLVNPIHTQSVTYIVQRMNSMAAMFYILSFLLYVKGRIYQIPDATQIPQNEAKAKPKKGSSLENRKTEHSFPIPASWLYFSGSLLTWLLSLGCKQITATLPFFIFLYEWYFFQDLSRDWLKRYQKHLFGIIILLALIATVFLGLDPLKKFGTLRDYGIKEFTFTERVLTQPRVVIYYLSLIFYPHPSRLNLDYDFPLSHSLIDPPTTLLALCAIIGLVGLAVYMAKKERLISFCILWFFGNLVIESSVIPLATIYEHRTYLPSMLICLMTVMLVVRYIRPKWLLSATICFMVMVCSVWTYERNRVWKDDIALWEDCVKKSPGKARPHNNLGIALEGQKNYKDAIRHYSEALRIKPDYFEAHNNMGNALLGEGRLFEAIQHYSYALDLNADYYVAHNNLGNMLTSQGKYAEAIQHYSEALRIKPDYAEAHNNWGYMLAEQRKLAEAIQHYSEALRIDPDYAEAHNNLATALAMQGRVAESIQHYSEALRIDPDYAEAHNNIGNILADEGRIDEAIKHYQKALAIKAGFIQALRNLAMTYMTQRDYEKALSLFKRIIERMPDDANTHYNIACIYAIQNNTEASIEWLKKAIERGFDNWDHLKTDKDLENIRDSSHYRELVKDH